MSRIATLLFVAFSLGAGAPVAGDPEIPTAAAGRIVFTQIPLRDRDEMAPVPDGSRLVLLDPASPDAEPTNLTPGFAAAGRPDLSFDGKRVLFVGRRTAVDPLNVWELNLDDKRPRQITRLEQDCSRAIYLASLFTLNAVEPERRIAYCVDDGSERGSGVACTALHTCLLDGSEARRISFAPHGVGDPHLLSDGRLLYVGARPPESGGGTALFTMHPDGTDVAAFAAVHEPPAIRGMPAEMDDGNVVYVESGLEGPDRGGALIAVNRARSLHGRRMVAGNDGGTYRSPSALPGGRMLVSYRPAQGGTYGIHRLDLQGDGRRVELFDAQATHDVDAVAVRARTRPAGRSSVVDDSVDHGFLYCLDAYLSDREAAAAILPAGIAGVRVFEGPSAGSAPGPEQGRLLAEFPVRTDGSFYLRLPALKPLRLETVDEAGGRLQVMENWIWVMPNEQRGCIGCHEDRERTPPNRHPMALRAQPLGIDHDEQTAKPADDHPAHGEHRE